MCALPLDEPVGINTQVLRARLFTGTALSYEWLAINFRLVTLTVIRCESGTQVPCTTRARLGNAQDFQCLSISSTTKSDRVMIEVRVTPVTVVHDEPVPRLVVALKHVRQVADRNSPSPEVLI